MRNDRSPSAVCDERLSISLDEALRRLARQRVGLDAEGGAGLTPSSARSGGAPAADRHGAECNSLVSHSGRARGVLG